MATDKAPRTKGIQRLSRGQCPLHGVRLIPAYAFKATLRGGYTALRCPTTDCSVVAKMTDSSIELFRECAYLLSELD